MKSLVVPAHEDALDEALGFAVGELERHGCSARVQTQIEMAMEEVFVNIVSYAYQPNDGDVEIRCEMSEDPIRITIQFLDSGHPFDPLTIEDPDTSEEGLTEHEGGLGIFMVKNMVDEVRYSYEGGKNILTITKKL